MFRKLIFTIIALLFFSVIASDSLASEGTIELRSLNDKNYRCYAASLQIENNVYNILVSCRNLLYPSDENVISYVMWATPSDGSGEIKLGALGYGKATFKTNSPFSNLFVTTELDSRVRSPNGSVVMRGNVQSIGFLTQAENGIQEELQEEFQPEPTPTPIKQLTTRERLLVGLRRAGLVSFLALVAIIGLVFVITRSR